MASMAVVMTAACAKSSDSGGGDSGTTTTAAPAAARGSADAPLTMATIVSTTGGLGQYGPGILTATQLAVKDINDAGGVNGKPVVLEANIDDATKPEVAQQAADTVINSSKAQALLGALGTKQSLAILDKVTGAGINMCSPSNTGAVFSTKDDHGGFYFRTAPSDDLQGPALADVITGDGHKKVAILARNDDYGKGFANAIESNLNSSGATVTANIAYDPNASDLSADVQKAVQSSPEAIAVIGYADDGAKILTGLIQNNFGPATKPVYTGDGMQSATVDKNGEVDKESLGYQTNPSDPFVIDGLGGTAPSADSSAEFKARFDAVKQPGDQNTFTGQSYDCTTIVALAAEAAKSGLSTDIQKKVLEVADDKGEVCTSFKDCKALLDQGKDIAYKGAIGEIGLDKNGDPTVGNYDVWTLEKGKIVTKDTIVQRKTS